MPIPVRSCARSSNPAITCAEISPELRLPTTSTSHLDSARRRQPRRRLRALIALGDLGVPRGGRTLRATARAVPRLLRRRPDQPRRDPVVRDRTRPRDARPRPAAGRALRATAGTGRARERTRDLAPNGRPISRTARAGVPHQTYPRLVAQPGLARGLHAEARAGRLRDRRQPARRRRRPTGRTWRRCS